MNQHEQPGRLLSVKLLIYAALFLAFAIGSASCSKKDQVIIPGKNLQQSKEIGFEIFPENYYDEEVSKEVAIRLKISVSGIMENSIQKQLLWDTLITSGNLHRYLQTRRNEPVKTIITAAPNTFRHLVINYLVVYSHQGNIITRSRAFNHGGGDKPCRIGL